MNVKNLEKELILKELEAENKALAQKTSMVAYIVIGASTMCCCCLAGLGIYFLADARKKERELQERLQMNMMFNKHSSDIGALPKFRGGIEEEGDEAEILERLR